MRFFGFLYHSIGLISIPRKIEVHNPQKNSKDCTLIHLRELVPELCHSLTLFDDAFAIVVALRNQGIRQIHAFVVLEQKRDG